MSTRWGSNTTKGNKAGHSLYFSYWGTPRVDDSRRWWDYTGKQRLQIELSVSKRDKDHGWVNEHSTKFWRTWPMQLPTGLSIGKCPLQYLSGFLSSSDAEEYKIGLRCASPIFFQFCALSLLISPAIFGHGEAGSHPDALQRDVVSEVLPPHTDPLLTHWNLG